MFHDFETNKKSIHEFVNNKVDGSARAHKVLQISELFREFEIINDTLKFKFKKADGSFEQRKLLIN